MNPSPDAFWWHAAPPANEANAECVALHEEFAAARQAAAAQLAAWMWMGEADQAGDAHLADFKEQALESVCGAQGDLAQWVWIFEMDERERALFRNIAHDPNALCAATSAIEFGHSTNWLGSFGLAACEPDQVGARRFARAGFLFQGLERAMSAEEAPFMVVGVGSEPERAGLRRWKERPAAWNRQPWVDAISDAYPDLAAEGLFSSPPPVGSTTDASHLRGALWKRRKVDGFPRPSQPSLAAQILFKALGGSRANPTDPWPTNSLRTWLESLELDASTQTPARAPTPRL